MSLTHAFKWSFLSEIASRLVQPLVFIVLARLLTPEDYGVVAAAAMVISFCSMFWDAGMGKALIQYQGDRNAAANAAFWVNVVLGSAVALILVLVSGIVSVRVFQDPRVGAVLKVMSLQVLLSALASVHSALLQKDMRFKRLFWVRLATVGVPGLISIPLALNGFGYWALILGTLGGQAVQVVVLWRMSAWKPILHVDLAVARRLLRFGSWVAATGLLFWFYSWADSLVVGIYLGAHELGLYRTGNAFVLMIFGTLFGPLSQVLYSFFSSIQQDRARIRDALLKVIRVITFISLPMAVFLWANSDLIADLVFGPKWAGIALVIGVLALVQGFSWVVGANGEAYRAVGAPSYETRIVAGALVFYMIGYWLSIRSSFEAFVWTRLGLSVGALSIHFWVAKLAVDLPVGKALRYLLKVGLFCSPALLLAHFIEPAGNYSRGLTVAALTLGLIGASMWLLERNGIIPELTRMVKRRGAA